MRMARLSLSLCWLWWGCCLPWVLWLWAFTQHIFPFPTIDHWWLSCGHSLVPYRAVWYGGRPPIIIVVFFIPRIGGLGIGTSTRNNRMVFRSRLSLVHASSSLFLSSMRSAASRNV